MGRALGNIIINLKGNEAIKQAIEELGLDLDVIEDQEPDAALGNGGLGRLAACFLDSLATLGYPAYGCGIRYKYGMFKQKIENGFQIETPDDWLKHGNPFEMKRAEYAVEVKFGGYVTVQRDENGKDHYVQENYQSVRAVPYDGHVPQQEARRRRLQRLSGRDAGAERVLLNGSFRSKHLGRGNSSIPSQRKPFVYHLRHALSQALRAFGKQ